MMAEVACFCGCFFSFEGADAATCPKCGKAAGVASSPRPDRHGPSGQSGAVPNVHVISQTGRSPEIAQRPAEVIALYCGRRSVNMR